MSEKKILVACDPEIFVRSGETISSIAGILGYGKENKLDMGNGIRLQEDNVLIEFDIDPCDNYGDFNGLIAKSIEECDKKAKEHGLELALGVSSHIYTNDEIESFDPAALVFGCSPDYNALTGVQYEKMPVHPGLRSAGGHVHIGWDHVKELSMEDQKMTAILCDYFLALPSLLLDSDTRRRDLYGKAGCTRFKPYGIEYRTLSNFWIGEDANRQLVWDQVQKAYKAQASGSWRELFAIVDPHQVQQIINTGDTALAEHYIKVGDIA